MTAKDFIETSDEFSIKKFVSEYADSDDSVTIDSLSEKYQIRSGVDKVFEYAIVNCIVSYKTAQKMKIKAHRNQARHCKKDVLHTASDQYYSNLLKRRFEYVVSKISDDKIREMVDAYIASPNLSAEIIANTFGFSRRELNALLEKAIVFNLIDDEKCNTLKAVAFDKVPKVRQKVVISELFNRYDRFRSYYKDLSSRIVQLHFQLDTYDDFIFSDEDEHCKAEKEKELQRLQKEFEAFRKNYYF